MAALPDANLATFDVFFRFRHSPTSTGTTVFDIELFEEPDRLYRFGWDYIFGDNAVSTDVDFRGFSSENQLVLQDNVLIPAGHIVHENLQRPIAGQIGVVHQHGFVYLLAMQWRRLGEDDWEWYSADAVDWGTFRDTVAEIFAHDVLLAEVRLAPGSPERFRADPDHVPQNVRLRHIFGDPVPGGEPVYRIVNEAEMQAFGGHLEFYNFISEGVFGLMADNGFHPVNNFRGILGNNIDGVNPSVNLPVPNQTVGGQLGVLAVDGDVIGQFRINDQGQLVLLAIKWRAQEDATWRFYNPQVHQWEDFRSAVSEIFAYGVLVAQFTPMEVLLVTLRFRDTPELIHAFEFDIAPYEDPDELYRFGWDYMFGDYVVTTGVDLRGFSSRNQLVVLQHNVMPGYIVHENLQRPVAGQFGVDIRRGLLMLLVMQWRHEGHADWEWYSADAVDWHTFRASVREIFAHAVLLVQFHEPVEQNIPQYRVSQDVRLWRQTFGNHMLDELIIPAHFMQAFDHGPLQLYNILAEIVFGGAASDFHPVTFRGILGGNIGQQNVNGNFPWIPNQTVGGQLELVEVEGVIIGQLGINAQEQLVLLVIKWRDEDNEWRFYQPQVHRWEEFRRAVRQIFAYGVLVAQF